MVRISFSRCGKTGSKRSDLPRDPWESKPGSPASTHQLSLLGYTFLASTLILNSVLTANSTSLALGTAIVPRCFHDK